MINLLLTLFLLLPLTDSSVLCKTTHILASQAFVCYMIQISLFNGSKLSLRIKPVPIGVVIGSLTFYTGDLGLSPGSGM